MLEPFYHPEFWLGFFGMLALYVGVYLFCEHILWRRWIRGNREKE